MGWWSLRNRSRRLRQSLLFIARKNRVELGRIQKEGMIVSGLAMLQVWGRECGGFFAQTSTVISWMWRADSKANNRECCRFLRLDLGFGERTWADYITRKGSTLSGGACAMMSCSSLNPSFFGLEKHGRLRNRRHRPIWCDGWRASSLTWVVNPPSPSSGFEAICCDLSRKFGLVWSAFWEQSSQEAGGRSRFWNGDELFSG